MLYFQLMIWWRVTSPLVWSTAEVSDLGSVERCWETRAESLYRLREVPYGTNQIGVIWWMSPLIRGSWQPWLIVDDILPSMNSRIHPPINPQYIEAVCAKSFEEKVMPSVKRTRTGCSWLMNSTTPNPSSQQPWKHKPSAVLDWLILVVNPWPIGRDAV